MDDRCIIQTMQLISLTIMFVSPLHRPFYDFCERNSSIKVNRSVSKNSKPYIPILLIVCKNVSMKNVIKCLLTPKRLERVHGAPTKNQNQNKTKNYGALFPSIIGAPFSSQPLDLKENVGCSPFHHYHQGHQHLTLWKESENIDQERVQLQKEVQLKEADIICSQLFQLAGQLGTYHRCR